jgi:hypothetical protein
MPRKEAKKPKKPTVSSTSNRSDLKKKGSSGN